MASTEIFFTLAYLLVAACLVSPPTEFISAGLTVQNVFASFLGSEQMNFVIYHIRRTMVTMIVHSLIPLGYYIGMCAFSTQDDVNFLRPSTLAIYWRLYLAVAVILPCVAVVVASWWSRNKSSEHPISKSLRYLAPTGSTWHAVASSINVEFRRFDKFTTGQPGRRLIVTDSWLILTSTYVIYVARQSDVHLTILGTDEHTMSIEGNMGVQFLNILVSGIERHLKPFKIRLVTTEYSDLKDKLRSPIINARNIIIHQSLSDRFIDAFRYQVNQNERCPNLGATNGELEPCIGCMQTPPNIKLRKLCNEPDVGPCVQCYCRPMWCLECMGKWFASRQDQSQPETWMSCRSPCPTCRAPFCMLDVCLLA